MLNYLHYMYCQINTRVSCFTHMVHLCISVHTFAEIDKLYADESNMAATMRGMAWNHGSNKGCSEPSPLLADRSEWGR